MCCLSLIRLEARPISCGVPGKWYTLGAIWATLAGWHMMGLVVEELKEPPIMVMVLRLG